MQGLTAQQVTQPGAYSWIDPKGMSHVGYVVQGARGQLSATFVSADGHSRAASFGEYGNEGLFFGPITLSIPPAPAVLEIEAQPVAKPADAPGPIDAVPAEPATADLGDPPHKNVRHDLDPVLVQAQIEKKVANTAAQMARRIVETTELCQRYEADMAAGKTKNWARKPDGPAEVERYMTEWMAHERDYYAKVRVIELPQPGKRFLLVYGDADDATVTKGTGPFESIHRAQAWFFNGGR
jgi:hypothetical protein